MTTIIPTKIFKKIKTRTLICSLRINKSKYKTVGTTKLCSNHNLKYHLLKELKLEQDLMI